jgi:hypothetical protein
MASEKHEKGAGLKPAPLVSKLGSGLVTVFAASAVITTSAATTTVAAFAPATAAVATFTTATAAPIATFATTAAIATAAATPTAVFTATATTATTAAESAAWRTFFLGTCDIYINATPIEFFSVKTFDRCLCFFIRAHRDEGEAARATGHFVRHENCFRDGAVCGKGFH